MIALSSLLTACGIKGSVASEAQQKVDWPSYWAKQKKAGVLDFANWPLYIDQQHGKSNFTNRQKSTQVLCDRNCIAATARFEGIRQSRAR